MFEPGLDPLASRKRKLEDKEEGEEEERKDSKFEEGKEAKFVTGVPLTNMPGHTGYLTFATMPGQLAG